MLTRLFGWTVVSRHKKATQTERLDRFLLLLVVTNFGCLQSVESLYRPAVTASWC